MSSKKFRRHRGRSYDAVYSRVILGGSGLVKNKIRKTILGLFCVMIFIEFSSPAAYRHSQWKGKKNIENGITIVKNPAEPLYGEFSFQLEEDLTIGGDPKDEFRYFLSAVKVKADNQENLYVVDPLQYRVLKFDSNGRFIKKIGGRGQGPGEYQFPQEVFINRNVYVFGPREILVYDQSGGFIKKIYPRIFLGKSALGPDESIFGINQPNAREGFVQRLIRLDPDGEIAGTIAEFKGEAADSSIGMVNHWYSSNIIFSPVSHDLLAYGYSSEYRINFVDGKGNRLWALDKEEKLLPISRREKDETGKPGGYFSWFGIGNKKPTDSIIFPDHRPHISFKNGALQSDDQGRLYVFRLPSILDKIGPNIVDVFSGEGIYLYRMHLPFVPVEIKRGSIYRVRVDEDSEENFVVRYRIKNWEAMKSH